jgi:hypothetical protein
MISEFVLGLEWVERRLGKRTFGKDSWFQCLAEARCEHAGIAKEFVNSPSVCGGAGACFQLSSDMTTCFWQEKDEVQALRMQASPQVVAKFGELAKRFLADSFHLTTYARMAAKVVGRVRADIPFWQAHLVTQARAKLATHVSYAGSGGEIFQNQTPPPSRAIVLQQLADKGNLSVRQYLLKYDLAGYQRLESLKQLLPYSFAVEMVLNNSHQIPCPWTSISPVWSRVGDIVTSTLYDMPKRFRSSVALVTIAVAPVAALLARSFNVNWFEA